MIVALLALATTGGVQPCKGETTPELDYCLAARRDAAEREMQRYLAAARIRVGGQEGEPLSPAKLQAGLDAAQAQWRVYREAQCGNVFDFWAGGTTRVSKAINCTTRLTQARTHFLWQTSLTYPDSTAPILPEPKD